MKIFRHPQFGTLLTYRTERRHIDEYYWCIYRRTEPNTTSSSAVWRSMLDKAGWVCVYENLNRDGN